MTRLKPLAHFRVPLGGQEIELQQIDFAADGGAAPHGGEPHAPAPDAAAPCTAAPMLLLRTRIRENKRFTVFDIDPLTAEAWGRALLDWARTQPRG